MIVVYNSIGVDLDQYFPPYQAVTITEDWRDLCRFALRATCAVVAIPTLSPSQGREGLRKLKIQSPKLPVVLITHRSAENLRAICDISIAAVVWISDVRRGLWPAVRKARRADLLAEHANRIEHAFQIPSRLRSALAYACRCDPPIRSVHALATGVDCHPQTLRDHWRRSTVGLDLRLQDFVGWLLLLRALSYKRSSQAWPDIAGLLGISVKRLQRLARRLTNCTLGELEGLGSAALSEEFEREVLGAVLSTIDSQPPPTKT